MSDKKDLLEKLHKYEIEVGEETSVSSSKTADVELELLHYFKSYLLLAQTKNEFKNELIEEMRKRIKTPIKDSEGREIPVSFSEIAKVYDTEIKSDIDKNKGVLSIVQEMIASNIKVEHNYNKTEKSQPIQETEKEVITKEDMKIAKNVINILKNKSQE